MRHVRMIGLCLIAVVAVVAFAAASASAASPEWGRCVAKTGGKYSNENCTTKAKKGAGSFEFENGAKVGNVKFTGAGGVGVLSIFPRACPGKAEGIITEGSERTRACEEAGAKQFEELFVECKSENATGEQSGKSDVKNIQVTFHECAALGSIPCTNTANEGEVQTTILDGQLGYINKAKNEVGVLLAPAKKKAPFANFACGNGLLLSGVGVGNPKTEGCSYKETSKCGGDGIISPITPVDEMTSAFTQVYTQNSEDENIPSKFEGKPRASLESYLADGENPKNSSLWSHAGEVITNVNTPEKPGEIRTK